MAFLIEKFNPNAMDTDLKFIDINKISYFFYLSVKYISIHTQVTG